MSDEVTITVEGQTWSPRIPDDYCLVDDLVTLGAYNVKRAFAAALVATWAGKSPPRVSYRACAHNPGDFGGECVNELMKRGLTIPDILEQGGLAYAALSRWKMTKEEVDSVEGFSEAGADSGNSS